MATFDLTSSATAGVNSNSIAALPASRNGLNMRMIEGILDIDKLTNYSCTNGDIFQVVEIPANTMVLFAGAEVLRLSTGLLLLLTLTLPKAMTLLMVAMSLALVFSLREATVLQ